MASANLANNTGKPNASFKTGITIDMETGEAARWLNVMGLTTVPG